MNEKAAAWTIAILVIIIWSIIVYVVWRARQNHNQTILSRALYPFSIIFPAIDGIKWAVKKSKHHDDDRSEGGWVSMLPAYRPIDRPRPQFQGGEFDDPVPRYRKPVSTIPSTSSPSTTTFPAPTPKVSTYSTSKQSSFPAQSASPFAATSTSTPIQSTTFNISPSSTSPASSGPIQLETPPNDDF